MMAEMIIYSDSRPKADPPRRLKPSSSRTDLRESGMRNDQLGENIRSSLEIKRAIDIQVKDIFVREDSSSLVHCWRYPFDV